MHFKVSARSVRLWQIRLFPIAVALIVIAAVFLKVNIAAFVFLSVFALLFSLTVVIYIPLYIKSFEISCLDNAIIVKSGVIITVSHILPFPRTVYYRTYSTYLSQKLGLCGIVLKGARANIIIPETKKNDIENIISKITESCDE